MSYMFNNPCYNCNKESTCTDKKMIREAIDKIHQTTYEQGHQGSGEVLLSCLKLDSKSK